MSQSVCLSGGERNVSLGRFCAERQKRVEGDLPVVMALVN